MRRAAQEGGQGLEEVARLGCCGCCGVAPTAVKAWGGDRVTLQCEQHGRCGGTRCMCIKKKHTICGATKQKILVQLAMEHR